MKAAYHIFLHLLGVACIAACLAIVGTMGDLDIHWSGWIAVSFIAALALGILAGWFPWRGKPARVLLKGVYLMSALALIGFGFAIDDPLKPQWWMVLAPLATAAVLRIVIRMASRGRSGPDGSSRPPASEDDPFFR